MERREIKSVDVEQVEGGVEREREGEGGKREVCVCVRERGGGRNDVMERMKIHILRYPSYIHVHTLNGDSPTLS